MQEFLDFIYKNHSGYCQKKDDEFLTRNILNHIRNNTFDYIKEDGEVKAIVRYNIINNGRVADVLDLVIKPKERGETIIKYFVANGWLRFPSLKFVRFEREFKHPEKQHKMIEIQRFFTHGQS